MKDIIFIPQKDVEGHELADLWGAHPTWENSKSQKE